MLSSAEIERRFAHHVPRTEARIEARIDEHDRVRAIVRTAAVQLAEVLPASRESALAFTSLEEAMMWANASIARQPDAE